jgi:hypothetical protein
MASIGGAVSKTSSRAKQAVARASGLDNCARLLARYCNGVDAVTSSNAWQYVCRLLLWIDRTTALAHCYESNKAQPGRIWYARSLAFHERVSNALTFPPFHLGKQINWLFRDSVKDLASRALAIRGSAYEVQRASYKGRRFPQAGEDPEPVTSVKNILG